MRYHAREEDGEGGDPAKLKIEPEDERGEGGGGEQGGEGAEQPQIGRGGERAGGIQQAEKPGLSPTLGFVNGVGLECFVVQVGFVLVIEFRLADDGRGRVARAEQGAVREEAALSRPDEAANDEALTELVEVAKGFGRDESPLVAVKAEEEQDSGEEKEEEGFDVHLKEFKKIVCAKCGDQTARQRLDFARLSHVNPIVNTAAITPALGMILARFLVFQDEAHHRGELGMAVFKALHPLSQNIPIAQKTEHVQQTLRTSPQRFVNNDLLILDCEAVFPRFGMPLQRIFHAGGFFIRNQFGAKLGQRDDPVDALLDLVSLRDFVHRFALLFAGKVIARLARFGHAFVEEILEAFAVGVSDGHGYILLLCYPTWDRLPRLLSLRLPPCRLHSLRLETSTHRDRRNCASDDRRQNPNCPFCRSR